MLLEWDPAKNAKNLEQHGIGFERAYDLNWARALVMPTAPGNDPSRQRVLGFLDARLYSLIVTPRGNRLRVISLRPVNRQERRIYEAYVRRAH